MGKKPCLGDRLAILQSPKFVVNFIPRLISSTVGVLGTTRQEVSPLFCRMNENSQPRMRYTRIPSTPDENIWWKLSGINPTEPVHGPQGYSPDSAISLKTGLTQPHSDLKKLWPCHQRKTGLESRESVCRVKCRETTGGKTGPDDSGRTPISSNRFI